MGKFECPYPHRACMYCPNVYIPNIFRYFAYGEYSCKLEDKVLLWLDQQKKYFGWQNEQGTTVY